MSELIIFFILAAIRFTLAGFMIYAITFTNIIGLQITLVLSAIFIGSLGMNYKGNSDKPDKSFGSH